MVVILKWHTEFPLVERVYHARETCNPCDQMRSLTLGLHYYRNVTQKT